jgi:hypothetical protein
VVTRTLITFLVVVEDLPIYTGINALKVCVPAHLLGIREQGLIGAARSIVSVISPECCLISSPLALPGVTQHGVCKAYLLKLPAARLLVFALLLVGVVLQCRLSVRFLDFRFIGRLGDLQSLVKKLYIICLLCGEECKQGIVIGHDDCKD